jgi:hypothetical protein
VKNKKEAKEKGMNENEWLIVWRYWQRITREPVRCDNIYKYYRIQASAFIKTERK